MKTRVLFLYVVTPGRKERAARVRFHTKPERTLPGVQRFAECNMCTAERQNAAKAARPYS